MKTFSYLEQEAWQRVCRASSEEGQLEIVAI